MWISKREKIILIFILIFSFFVKAQDYNYPFDESSRDPFTPLISKSGQILIPRKIEAKNLVLNGIIYSPQNSIVVINGEILKEKDKVGEYTIFKIEEKKVILKKKDKKIILKLEEE
ncbi:MAG TPA: hypothetical protein EYP89_01010 [Candidatus Omnitrophica bacterium]|nr:hypothetical protein [Candidatus Omnitrophota bacterium]